MGGHSFKKPTDNSRNNRRFDEEWQLNMRMSRRRGSAGRCLIRLIDVCDCRATALIYDIHLIRKQSQAVQIQTRTRSERVCQLFSLRYQPHRVAIKKMTTMNVVTKTNENPNSRRNVQICFYSPWRRLRQKKRDHTFTEINRFYIDNGAETLGGSCSWGPNCCRSSIASDSTSAVEERDRVVLMPLFLQMCLSSSRRNQI